MDKRIKILCVDDSATMRRILTNTLKELGFYNISTAEDGVVALEKLKKDKFLMIISDWDMPNMDGLQLLKKIREMKEYEDIPFLMVTAEAQKHNVIQAVHAGVSNYVIKPFTTESIADKIKKIMAYIKEK